MKYPFIKNIYFAFLAFFCAFSVVKAEEIDTLKTKNAVDKIVKAIIKLDSLNQYYKQTQQYDKLNFTIAFDGNHEWVEKRELLEFQLQGNPTYPKENETTSEYLLNGIKRLKKFNTRNDLKYQLYSIIVSFKQSSDWKIESKVDDEDGLTLSQMGTIFKPGIKNYEKYINTTFGQFSSEIAKKLKNTLKNTFLLFASEHIFVNGIDKTKQKCYIGKSFDFVDTNTLPAEALKTAKNIISKIKTNQVPQAERSLERYFFEGVKSGIIAIESYENGDFLGDNECQENQLGVYKNSNTTKRETNWNKDVEAIANKIKAPQEEYLLDDFAFDNPNRKQFKLPESAKNLWEEYKWRLDYLHKQVSNDQKINVKYIYFQSDYAFACGGNRSIQNFVDDIISQKLQDWGNNNPKYLLVFYIKVLPEIDEMPAVFQNSVRPTVYFFTRSKAINDNGEILNTITKIKSTPQLQNPYTIFDEIFKAIPKPYTYFSYNFNFKGDLIKSKRKTIASQTGKNKLFDVIILQDKRTTKYLSLRYDTETFLERSQNSTSGTPNQKQIQENEQKREEAKSIENENNSPQFEHITHGLKERIFEADKNNDFSQKAEAHIRWYRHRIFKGVATTDANAPSLPDLDFIEERNEVIYKETIENFEALSLLLSPVSLDFVADAGGLIYASYYGDVSKATEFSLGFVMPVVDVIKFIKGQKYLHKGTDNAVKWIDKSTDIIRKNFENIQDLSKVSVKNVDGTTLSGFTWFKNLGSNGDGCLDIVIHGQGNSFKIFIEGVGQKTISADEFAQYLLPHLPKDPNTIRLLSCSDLKSAEKISEALDRPVIATNSKVEIYENGGIKSSTDEWFEIQPNGSKKTVSPPPGSRTGKKVVLGNEIDLSEINSLQDAKNLFSDIIKNVEDSKCNTNCSSVAISVAKKIKGEDSLPLEKFTKEYVGETGEIGMTNIEQYFDLIKDNWQDFKEKKIDINQAFRSNFPNDLFVGANSINGLRNYQIVSKILKNQPNNSNLLFVASVGHQDNKTIKLTGHVFNVLKDKNGNIKFIDAQTVEFGQGESRLIEKMQSVVRAKASNPSMENNFTWYIFNGEIIKTP